MRRYKVEAFVHDPENPKRLKRLESLIYCSSLDSAKEEARQMFVDGIYVESEGRYYFRVDRMRVRPTEYSSRLERKRKRQKKNPNKTQHQEGTGKGNAWSYIPPPPSLGRGIVSQRELKRTWGSGIPVEKVQNMGGHFKLKTILQFADIFPSELDGLTENL